MSTGEGALDWKLPSPMSSLLRRWNVAINVVSTLLTVLTGLNENAILLLFIGRFSHVRLRLKQGRINYGIARFDLLPTHMLPDLAEVGETYIFHRAPVRTPSNLGEDRSVCLRVNSMSTTTLTQNYDDMFGARPRRDQVFVYSVSAPSCDVINFDPQWFHEQCVHEMFRGNVTACHDHILGNFEQLKQQRPIHVGIPEDFGTVGVPFLKCRDRPQEPFKYGTDLLVMQTFWGGGRYHVEIQSSVCWARPVGASHSGIALFQTAAVDEQASVVMAIPPPNIVCQLVSGAYAVITLAMVVRGVKMLFVSRDNDVVYVPSARRRGRGWFLSLIDVGSFFQPVHMQADVVRFAVGGSLVGSNLWMNDWRYMSISILESCVNIRKMYMVLEMGTWMLAKQVSFENFLFMCAALTRLTWLTCLVHTVVRTVLLSIVDVLDRTVSLWSRRGATVCKFLRWYIGGVALLSNFKLYSLLLLLQLYAMLKIHGTTTTMRRASPFKRPLLAGHVLASLLLLFTRLRLVVSNKMLRILQRRYVFVGWDVFVAMDALGIDPFPASEAAAATHCSIAALTRQLSVSGPSASVRFAGDGVFTPARDDLDLLRYPLQLAVRMGLWIEPIPLQPQKKKKTTGALSMRSLFLRVQPSIRLNAIRQPTKSNVDHVLSVHPESRWGALVLVDLSDSSDAVRVASPSEQEANDEGGVVAVRDALQALPPTQRHELLAGTLKLRLT